MATKLSNITAKPILTPSRDTTSLSLDNDLNTGDPVDYNYD